MSKVTIFLEDSGPEMVGIVITVSDYAEDSGAVAMGQQIQDYINQATQIAANAHGVHVGIQPAMLQ